MFGEIQDIRPFSNKTVYRKLASDIKNQWLRKPYPEADILPPYKSTTFYPDAQYFVLRTEDGRIQALANVEVQNDGVMWGRSLNTAPWNQGSNPEIRGAGKLLLQEW